MQQFSMVVVEKNYREVYVEAEGLEEAWDKFDAQHPEDVFHTGVELQSEYEYCDEQRGPTALGESKASID